MLITLKLSIHKGILKNASWSMCSTILNIENIKKCFLTQNQHIRMISEGSYDTQLSHHRNTLHSTALFNISLFILYIKNENICNAPSTSQHKLN